MIQECCTVLQPRLVPSYMFELGPAADYCQDEKCLNGSTKTLYLDNCTIIVSKKAGSDKLAIILFKEDPYDYWRHFISISGWENVTMADIEVRQASEFGPIKSGEFKIMILRKTPLINPIFIQFSSDWTETKGSALNHRVEGEWIMRYHDEQFIILLNKQQLYVLENKNLLSDHKPVVEFAQEFIQFEVCRLGSIILLNVERTELYFMNSSLELEKLPVALSDISLVDTSHGHFIVVGKNASGQTVEYYIKESKEQVPSLKPLQREFSSTPLISLELAGYFVFGYDNITEILYKDSHFGSISSAKRMNVDTFVAVIHHYRSSFQNIVGLIIPKKDRNPSPTLFLRQFNLLTGWITCNPRNSTENLTGVVSTRVHIKTLKFPLGVTINFFPQSVPPVLPEGLMAQSDQSSKYRYILYVLAVSLLVAILTILTAYKCYFAKQQKEVIRAQEMIFNVATPDADAEQVMKGTLGFEKKQTAQPADHVSNIGFGPSRGSKKEDKGLDEEQGTQEISYAEEFDVEESAVTPKDPDDRKEDLEDYTHPSVRKRGGY